MSSAGSGKSGEQSQFRPLTGRKAASIPSIPEATTGKPFMECFEQAVSADNLLNNQVAFR